MECILKIKRIAFKEKYTIGKLYINGEYFCDTLEDAVREKKIKHETAIPKGEYEVIMYNSPRFKRLLPLLKDVPNFTGILIHRGNTNADTSGCILVGENKKVGMVLNSKKYETDLVAILDSPKWSSIRCMVE
jgi:hypothetical protein